MTSRARAALGGLGGRLSAAGRERVSPEVAERLAQARARTAEGAARLRDGVARAAEQHGVTERAAQARQGVVNAAEQARVAERAAQVRQGVVNVAGQARVAERAAQVRQGVVNVAGQARVAERSGQLVRGAARLTEHGAQFAGRAGRGARGTAREYFTGVSYYWIGLARLATSPVLWLYLIVPALLPVVFIALVSHEVTAWSNGLVDWATGWSSGWDSAHWLLHTAVRYTISSAVHAVLGLLSLPVSFVLGALGYVLITRRVERQLGGDSTARIPWYQATALAAATGLVVLVGLELGGVLIALLATIPVAGLPLSLAGLLVVSGLVLGTGLMVLPLQHRGVLGIGALARFVWSRRAPVMGLGAMSAVMVGLPIPYLQGVTVPAAFVGGLLLFRQLTPAPVPPQQYPAPQHQPPAPGR